MNKFFLTCCVVLFCNLQAFSQLVLKVDHHAYDPGHWAEKHGPQEQVYQDLWEALDATAFWAEYYHATTVEIWVAEGTYTPFYSTENRYASFQLGNNMTVRGGFAGTETLLSQRPTNGFETILTGDLLRNTGSSYNVVTCRNVTNAILERLTISGGKADNRGGYRSVFTSFTQGAIESMAGADPGTDANPNLTGNTLRPLAREVAGGGIFVDNPYGLPSGATSLTLTNCTIANNFAVGYGGGLAAWRANVKAFNCRFFNNTSGEDGGGFWGLNNRIQFQDCDFADNKAGGDGGGMAIDAIPTIKNVAPDRYGVSKDVETAIFVIKTVGGAKAWIPAARGVVQAVKVGASAKGIAGAAMEGLINDTKVLRQDLGNFGSAYNLMGVAITTVSFATQLAVWCGGNPNDPFVVGFGKFADFFNSYLTPAGWAFEILGLAGVIPHPPGFRDQEAAYAQAQYGNYNAGAYSTVQGCTFRNNSAAMGGGVMLTYDNVEFNSCWFLTNRTSLSGAGLTCMAWTTPRVFDCAFSFNVSSNGFSAIYNAIHARSQILQCTIVNNRSLVDDCAVGNELGSAVKIFNSVLWNNTSVALGSSTPRPGADIFTAASFTLSGPARNNYDDAGPAHGDYVATCDLRGSLVQSLNSLHPGSEDFTDLRGTSPISFAASDAQGIADLNGFWNLGEGIRPTDLGNGLENISMNQVIPSILAGKAQVVPMPSSPLAGDLHGGAANSFVVHGWPALLGRASESDLFGISYPANSVRHPGAVQYQGSAQQGFSGFPFYVRAGATGLNTGLSWADAMTSLDSLFPQGNQFGTIGSQLPGVEVWIAGGATAGRDLTLPDGASLYGGFAGTETGRDQRNWTNHPAQITGASSRLRCSSIYLDGLIFDNCVIYSDDVPNSVTVTNCAFFNGPGRGPGFPSGGAISYPLGFVKAWNSKFVNCATLGQGGAIAAGNLFVQGCWFERCRANIRGGAVAAGDLLGLDPSYKNLSILDSVFVKNSAGMGGAAVELYLCPGSIYNCTFYGNTGRRTVEQYVQSVFHEPVTPLAGANCLLWQNEDDGVPGYYEYPDGTQAITIGGQDFGVHGVDPRFVDAAGLDFHLRADSPAVNVGGTNSFGVLPAMDFDGKPRRSGVAYDLGAYEFQGTPLPAPNFTQTATTICADTNGILAPLIQFDAQFVSGSPTISFQWQVDRGDGNGFVDIADGALYQGTRTAHLRIWNPDLSMNGYRYQLSGLAANGAGFVLKPQPLAVNPKVYYVDGRRRQSLGPNGAFDGSSWATASPYLSAAIAAAKPGQQIWVAQGTYYPWLGRRPDGVPAYEPSIAVVSLPNGVRILGGFNGTETDASQRNPQAALTVLDTSWAALTNMPAIGEYVSYLSEHPFQLFYGFAPPGSSVFINGPDCAPSAVLDGFTLTGATNSAIVNNGGSPTIQNCIFKLNSASQGSAAANYAGAAPTFASCVFTNNTSESGTIYQENSTGTWVNCLFNHNAAIGNGGAFAAINSTTLLLQTTVVGNNAQGLGGGFYGNNSKLILENSILWQNQDQSPGGSIAFAQAHLDGTGSLSISNSCVQGGSSGALNLDPLFVNPLGGDFRLGEVSPLQNGGDPALAAGLARDLAGNPRLLNGQVDLGAYQHQSTSLPTPLNLVSLPQPLRIIAPGIYDAAITTLSPAAAAAGWQWQVNSGSGFVPVPVGNGLYSIVTNGNQLILRLNIADVSGALNQLSFNQYRVLLPSAGFTSAPIALLQVSLPVVVYVNRAAPGPTHDGKSWATAYSSIDDALAAPGIFREIWVARGNYPAPGDRVYHTPPYPNGINLGGYVLKEGVAIYGGFAGNETIRFQRDWTRNATILDSFQLNADSSQVGSLSGAATLDGFTLNQASVSIKGTSPTFQNCLFQFSGGVVFVSGGSPAFGSCVFTNSDTAIYIDAPCNLNFQKCLFTRNKTGIQCYADATLNLSDCVFDSNVNGISQSPDARASVIAARCQFRANTGFAMNSLSGHLGNCLLINNGQCFALRAQTALNNHALATPIPPELKVVNSTFFANTHVVKIDPVASSAPAICEIRNSILWNNGAVFETPNAPTVSNSCVQGGVTGAGNIAFDPLFVDVGAGDFRLSPFSPAVNAGDSSYVSAGALDMSGNPRIFGGKADLGAYELQRTALGPLTLIQSPAPITGFALGSATFTAVLGPSASPNDVVWQENRGSGWTTLNNGAPYAINVRSNTTSLTIFPLTAAMTGYKYRLANPTFNASFAAVSLTVLPQLQVFVNPAATGAADGLTWNTGWRRIEDGLAAARAGQQVCVAAGDYQLASSLQPVGVDVYGGFAGELLPAQRNLALNQSVLRAPPGQPVIAGISSVLDGFTITGGNGVPAVNTGSPQEGAANLAKYLGDYSGYPPAPAPAHATIKNCLFTGNSHSAVSNLLGNPVFANCVFSNNASPANGGAVVSVGGAPVFQSCLFVGNQATGEGGAVYLSNPSARDNRSAPHTTFISCQFTGNTSSGEGGAISAWKDSNDDSGFGSRFSGESSREISLEISGCTFRSNSASKGGALSGRALDFFGAYQLYVIVNNSAFTGNSAGAGGALEAGPASYWSMNNCLAARNSSGGLGGGLDYSAEAMRIYGCTFADNIAGDRGGGIYYNRKANSSWPLTVRNSIFWNNSSLVSGQTVEAQQFYSVSPIGSYNFGYCDVQGLNVYGKSGPGNINSDPAFADPSAGNYTLQNVSYLINAGNNAFASGLDLADQIRIYGTVVDIGAYEAQTSAVPPILVSSAPTPAQVCDDKPASFFLTANSVSNIVWQLNSGSGFTDITSGGIYSISLTSTSSTLAITPATMAMNGWSYRYHLANSAFSGPALPLQVAPAHIVYVNAAATGSQDGLSWGNALTNLQDALNAGDCASEIWVAQGNYPVAVDAPLALKAFLGLYGGFVGGETDRSQRNIALHPTRILGNSKTLAIFYNDGSANSIDATAILDGFLLTGAGAFGAVYNLDASPVIRNCTFSNNTARAVSNVRYRAGSSSVISNCVFAANSGGGILNVGSAPLIIGCSFSNNALAQGNGAAMDNEDARPTITRCAFVQNNAVLGGAVYNNGTNAAPFLTACVFRDNFSIEGAALYNATGASATLRNSLIARNHGGQKGGAFSHHGVTLTLANCTVADNTAPMTAGGAWTEAGAQFIANNCIFWGNTVNVPVTGGRAQIDGAVNPAHPSSIINSIVQGGAPGSGNLNAAPFFASSASGDYHLLDYSPAIGSGDNSVVVSGDTDLDGAGRIFETQVDRGCYEYQGSHHPALTLLTAPSSVSVCAEQDVAFSAGGAGLAGYTFVWQALGVAGYTNIPNAAPYGINELGGISTLSVAGVSPALNGTTFRLLLQNGSLSITQAVFSLNVSSRPIYFVNGQVAHPGDGLSWSNAFATLGEAAAQGGCADIWVAAGTYTATNASGPAAIQLQPGMRIYGGFSGAETTVAQRNPSVNATLLLAAPGASAMSASGAAGLIDPFVLVDGLTISGGIGIPAVVNSGVSPTFRNCVFAGNTSGAVQNSLGASPVFNGCVFSNNVGEGAMRNLNASVWLTNCVFSGNTNLLQSGGALYNSDSSATIIACRFLNNSSVADGGAIACAGKSTLAISRTTLTGNSAGDSGGALSLEDGSAIIDDSLLALNQATLGGAFHSVSAKLDLLAVTITGNAAQSVGGLNLGGATTITNSILWNNGAGEASQVSGAATIAYSCVQGLNTFAGHHNIPYDPLFFAPAAGDFTLADGSPAVNAGASDAVIDPSVSVDLAGQPRIQNAGVDLGAYESAHLSSQVQIIQQPVSQHACAGETVTFTVTGSAGYGSLLTWEADTGAGFGPLPSDGRHSTFSSDDTATLVVANADVAMNNYRYRVQIQGSLRFSSVATLLVSARSVLYVNASAHGNNSGVDWANAFTNLPNALAVADICQELWVAAGTYTNGDVLALRNGIEIYGGFAGTETARDQRNWTNNPVVLAANGHTNLAQALPDASYPDRAPLLDGFVLTGASAFPALYLLQTSPLIRNCAFVGNSASSLVNVGGAPWIEKCSFRSNSVTALMNSAGGFPTLTNCVFIANQSSGGGGAVNNNGASLTVSGTSFIRNSAANGGAIFNAQDCPNIRIDHSVFTANTAGSQGGAIYNGSGSATEARNSLFNGNLAAGGGAIVNFSTLNLLQATLSGNSATLSGGSCLNSGGQAFITNSIIWGSSSSQGAGATFRAPLDGAFSIGSSIVQGGAPGANPFDPLFVNPAAGDFHLGQYSPAIDAGAVIGSPDATDLDSNLRVRGHAEDMGAYESSFASDGHPVQIASYPIPGPACDQEPSVNLTFGIGESLDYHWERLIESLWQPINSGETGANGEIYTLSDAVDANGIHNSTLTISNLVVALSGSQFRISAANGFSSSSVPLVVGRPSTIYVNAAAAPGGDGASWGSAYNDLTAAVGALDACHRILWIAKGTYAPNGFAPFVIPALRGGAQIFGGFNGTETAVEQRNPQAHPTILSGALRTGGVAEMLVQMDGSADLIDTNTLLDGLTIRGAQVGVQLIGASPLIINCLIESNSAGGLTIVDGSPTLLRCRFQANQGDLGAGVNIASTTLYSQPVFQNCAFRGNSAAISGGGMHSSNSGPVLINCVLSGNTATESGGAAEFSYGDYENFLPFTGPARLINCTVTGNSAEDAGSLDVSITGAALSWTFPPQVTAVNSIFWNNSEHGEISEAALLGAGSRLGVASSCVFGLGAPDSNLNFGGDPLFVSALPAGGGASLAGDFHMHASSAVLDAGDDSAVAAIAADFDGNPRINRKVDAGAYEYQGAPIEHLILTGSPQSTAGFPSGATVLHASASGDAVNYRWQIDRNDGQGFVNLSDDANYSGSATAALTITNIDLHLRGKYRAVITDRDGATVTSDPAIFTPTPVRWFVNAAASAGGDGWSWATALNDLQSVLANPGLGAVPMEVWVAAGTYLPSLTDTNVTFTLPNQVAVYGGFAGTETDLAQRDWVGHPTVVTGSLDPIFGLYSAVLVSSDGLNGASRWDGFILQEGITGVLVNRTDADPVFANCSFAGFQNQAVLADTGARPGFTNCSFGNLSRIVGVYNGSSVRLDACLVTNNIAASALVEAQNSSFTASHSVFSNNEGTVISGQGGSITLDQGSVFSGNPGTVVSNRSNQLTVADCTFDHNGVAIDHEGSSSPAIVNKVDGSLFNANRHGIYSEGDASQSLYVTNCNFFSHTDSALVSVGSQIFVYNCRFQGNSASYGGAIYCSAASAGGGQLFVGDCLFAGNYATVEGGAIYLAGGGLDIQNSTLTANRTDGSCGGFFANGGIGLYNSILWNNSGRNAARQLSALSTQAQFSGDPSAIQNSDVTGLDPWNGNLSLDPVFVEPVDPATAPTLSGDFRLTASSPVIDQGSVANARFLAPNFSDLDLNSVLDLAGNDRLVDNLDMGAFEFQGAAGTPLVITANPSSLINWPVRYPTVFTVAASGEAITYQWQVNDGGGWSNLVDGAVYSGSTTLRLVLTNAPAEFDNNSYRAVVASGRGGTLNSTAATLRTPPTRWYVNAAAPDGGDGRSWSTAFNRLPDAFSNPLLIFQSTEIWVAAGTYYPSVRNNAMDSLFLTNGLALYGGFSGTETNLSQRDWVANPTILSGAVRDPIYTNSVQLLVNDLPTGEALDDSVHVDGFTFQDARYGVVYNFNGGDYSNHGPVFDHCSFRRLENALTSGPNTSLHNSQFTACFITASLRWGGDVRSCIFGNDTTATYYGPEIGSSTNSVVADCQFTALQVGLRGTLFAPGGLRVQNCSFVQNISGAILETSNRVDHCVFRENWQTALVGGSCEVDNCLFFANRSDSAFAGGAIVGYDSLVVRNSTLAGNYSVGSGAGITSRGTLAIYNSILSRNLGVNGYTESDQIYLVDPDASVDVRNSDIEGLSPAGRFAGGNNTGVDPQFVLPLDGLYASPFHNLPVVDFHLRPESLLINSGDNSLVTSLVDFDGNARPISNVDPGAYEFQQPILRPTVLNQSLTNVVNASIPLVLTGTNISGGTNLSWTFISLPAHGVLVEVGVGPNLTYTPDADYFGADSFQFIAIDPGSPPSGTFLLPSLVGTISFRIQKTPAIVWANPADITYGTALSASQLNATSNVPGTFSYTPSAGSTLLPGLHQTLSVTFTPTDRVNYAPAVATASLNVQLPAPPITVERQANRSLEISLAKIAMRVIDPDVYPVTISSVSPVSLHGAGVTIASQRILYTPPNGFNDTDTFTYTVTDSSGLSATGTITVVVAPDVDPARMVLHIEDAPTPDIDNPSVIHHYKRVTFAGIPGRTYQIQAASDLNHPTWTLLGTALADSTGLYRFLDLDSENYPMRFYGASSP